MKNQLYTRLLPRSEPDPEGGKCDHLTVTEEANCYAVWFSAFEHAETIVYWSRSRNEAIEWAVTSTFAQITNDL